MTMKMPKMDELPMNMTPMIDIVFMLILFFLLNLRFKSLDYRIETELPRDRGLAVTSNIVQDIPAIKITMFRDNEDDEAKAQTKLKINGGNPIFLPIVKWTRGRKADSVIEDMRDGEFRKIQARIEDLLKSNPELKGEIEAPPPKGAAVPHADVIRILDCFLAAGVTNVNFVGASFPLPKKAGGSQNQ